VLRRGFALVTDPGGHPIGSARDTAPRDRIQVEFHDGRIAATVDEKPESKARERVSPAKAPQGRLF
jgi:exodeoxyribonuclease VII large subunit